MYVKRERGSVAGAEVHLLTCAAADRVEQLKKAPSEASKEIKEYKKTMEQAFKSFESSVRYHAPTSAD
jgi:hypothetical protein